MFAGINVCIFETKTCSQGLIFAVSSGVINYLGTSFMFPAIYFCDFNMIAKIANKSLTNINEFTVCHCSDTSAVNVYSHY